MLEPGGKRPTEARIAYQVEQILSERIPPGWRLQARNRTPVGRSQVDLLVEIRSPKGESAYLAIEIKRSLEPIGIRRELKEKLKVMASELPCVVPVVASAYISNRARTLLRDSGLGYVDTTGNVRIETSAPGLFISAEGADRDPWPKEHKLKSLRGRGAARAIRAIVDKRPPFGVRELAGSTSASPATLSRVLDLLEREAIVTRSAGAVSSVDWEAAIRRWAEDYDLIGSNTVVSALEPRGIASIEKKLRSDTIRYAATSAFAAQQFDPIFPARQAVIYVTDIDQSIDRLDLVETPKGANVLLIEPSDPVVMDRTLNRDGLCCAAPSQLAVDLLTGPGRDPSQGEQMLQWMDRNQDVWRS